MIDVWDVILFCFAAVPVSLSYYFGYRYLRQLGHVINRSRSIVFGQEVRSEAEQLTSLCPPPIAKTWRSITAPIMFLFVCPLIVLPIIFLIFASGSRNFLSVVDIELVAGLSCFDLLLILLFVSALYSSIASIRKNHMLRQENLLVLDESGRYQTAWVQKSFSQKAIPTIAFLLIAYVILVQFNDEIQVQQDPPWGLFAMLLIGISGFVGGNLISIQAILTNSGFYNNGSKTDWSSVAEYRWFHDRDEVVLFLHAENCKSPIQILIMPADKTEEVAAYLEQKLPGNRREDVETTLEQLDSIDDSLSLDQTPA